VNLHSLQPEAYSFTHSFADSHSFTHIYFKGQK